MAATTAEAAAQLIYPPNVQANTSLTTVKFISSCFAGATAGILGLENWLGFVLFVVSTLFTSICINTINCRGKPSKYIHGGLSELVNPGQDNAFTFILVWTLFYGIVHGAMITYQDGIYTPANISTWLSVRLVFSRFHMSGSYHDLLWEPALYRVFYLPCSLSNSLIKYISFCVSITLPFLQDIINTFLPASNIEP